MQSMSFGLPQFKEKGHLRCVECKFTSSNTHIFIVIVLFSFWVCVENQPLTSNFPLFSFSSSTFSRRITRNNQQEQSTSQNQQTPLHCGA